MLVPSSAATIYSSSGFGGQAQELAIGDHRVSGASSIRVTPGTVAIVYRSADDAGGYGVSVDLLEDQPDLAKFGLDQVSFVSVFPATKDNLYFWARGAMRDGQYIPGHWERNRASGNPAGSTVAVASPPLPARGATIATTVEHQGSVWTITHLGTQSSGDAAGWELADRQMGVIGSDYRGPQRIGDAAFERASNNVAIPDWINFWYPNPPSMPANDHRGRTKRTLVGNILDKVTKNWTGTVLEQGPNGTMVPRIISGEYELSSAPHVSDIQGTYEDFDLNVDVLPYADYAYLIKDSHPPERSTIKYLKDLVDSDHDPCTDPFIKVEAEIDSSATAKQKLATALSARVGKQVAFYGPWIYDVGHCDHPEIHPAEEIWWTDTAFTDYAGTVKNYTLNVIADASKRFWWRSQMDGDNKMHPWGAPPITGLFAVAFEVSLNQTSIMQSGKQYRVQDVDFYNVKILTDNSRSFDLKYNGSTLVSFVPGSPAFAVSYEGVGLKPGTPNIIRGFLVIETTVGSVRQKSTRGVVLNGTSAQYIDVPQGADPDTVDQRIESQIFEKTAGHYLFRLIETSLSNQPQRIERTQ
jgi:hypothetical protein